MIALITTCAQMARALGGAAWDHRDSTPIEAPIFFYKTFNGTSIIGSCLPALRRRCAQHASTLMQRAAGGHKGQAACQGATMCHWLAPRLQLSSPNAHTARLSSARTAVPRTGLVAGSSCPRSNRKPCSRVHSIGAQNDLNVSKRGATVPAPSPHRQEHTQDRASRVEAPRLKPRAARHLARHARHAASRCVA